MPAQSGGVDGLRIAVVGKGGSGKSVIAGTLSRLLARRGERVLALDFDTVPGLAFTIGLPPLANAGLPPELGVRGKRSGWRLARRIAASTLVRKYGVDAPDGVRFLQLGKLPDGVKPGSSVAFRHVAETFRRPGWSIIGDLAAGTRQSFFGWARFATTFLVIVEPSSASLVAARRLGGLRDTHSGAAMGVVLSKVRTAAQRGQLERALDLPIWGEVPYDASVADADRVGRALIDVAPGSAAVAAIARLIDRLQAADGGKA